MDVGAALVQCDAREEKQHTRAEEVWVVPANFLVVMLHCRWETLCLQIETSQDNSFTADESTSISPQVEKKPLTLKNM